jgi:hypothetical protein
MGRVMLIRTIRASLIAAGIAAPGLKECKDFVDGEFEACGLTVHDEMSSRQCSDTIARGVGIFVHLANDHG